MLVIGHHNGCRLLRTNGRVKHALALFRLALFYSGMKPHPLKPDNVT